MAGLSSSFSGLDDDKYFGRSTNNIQKRERESMFTSMPDSCIRRVRPYVCWTELEFYWAIPLQIYIYTHLRPLFILRIAFEQSLCFLIVSHKQTEKTTVSTVCTCFAKYERLKAIWLVIIVMIVVLALATHHFLCHIRRQMSQTRQPGLPAWPPSSTICIDVCGSVMHHAVTWSHAERHDSSPLFMTDDLVCHSVTYWTIFSLLM